MAEKYRDGRGWVNFSGQIRSVVMTYLQFDKEIRGGNHRIGGDSLDSVDDTRLRKGKQNRAEDDAVDREGGETMRPDETEQPFHRDKGGHGRHHEGDAEPGPVLLADAVLHLFQQLVAARRIHRRDADEKGELGRRGAVRGAQQHRGEDRRARARGAGEDAGDDLCETHGDRDAQGDAGAVGQPRGDRLGAKDPDPAQHQRPGNRRDRLGQLEAELLHHQAKHGGDQKGDGQLEQIIAVLGGTPVQEQPDDPLPVDQRDGEDRPGLDHDVVGVGPGAEPVFGQKQVPGAGDRQELGDALDDAEEHVIQIGQAVLPCGLCRRPGQDGLRRFFAEAWIVSYCPCGRKRHR
ncbi:hypothetical protein SDC9_06475 [bioreactor metagenome]|uniref:Uncharacterized protein n=1 Tax=bioreactor metagenome TaxID=1076179 RepID=A0A644T4R4_9ZZZZ